MEDMERLEQSLAERDGEMLENLRMCFTRAPGTPSSWEELPEADKASIRRFYWKSMGVEIDGGQGVLPVSRVLHTHRSGIRQNWQFIPCSRGRSVPYS